MEVVLQWLDELDDLVYAGFSIWGRLRRFFLAVALTAALAIHAVPRLGVSGDLIVLVVVSLAALAAWGIIAAVSAAAEHGAKKSAEA
jgi:hypothetical protein